MRRPFLDWLTTGHYKTWASETGPHFGDVRSVYGNAFGDGTCIGCHAPDHPAFKDFFLSPFPLQ